MICGGCRVTGSPTVMAFNSWSAIKKVLKDMYTDPNWLLSTVVQSAAAFVAIIGGFILSRLLALSAERGGLEARIRDIELQLAIKRQNFSFLQKRLLEWDALDFLEDSDVLDKIIESEGQISLVDAMNRTTGCKRSEEELQPYWDEVIAATKNAFHLGREHFSEPPDESQDPDMFIRNLGINLSSLHLKIYYRVYGHLLAEHERRRNPFGSIMNSVSVRMPDILSADEINRYRILERDIETLEREINALETQSSDLKIQLKHLGYPKGVTLGIIVLAYFSLTGIVVPVFLLPFPPEQFTPIHKWSIFLLFVSGLVLFFVYLFGLIRQLAEKADSSNRPTD